MGSWTDIEGPIHRACLAYLRTQFPDGVIHHSANENPMKGRAIARAIAKNKLNGMLPGYPDLVLHWRGMTMGFEVKGPKGALTDAQKAVRDAFSANSIPYAVVRSVDDVKAALKLLAPAFSHVEIKGTAYPNKVVWK